MKTLFNKTGTNGPEELNLITGNYYANNDYSKIELEVLLECERIRDLVGPAVYQLAEDCYHVVEGAADHSALLQHLQLPVALAATFNFYQANIISHEDTGRKLKIDKTSEAIAWEWMYDRDDQANERKTFKAVDRLIKFLDELNLPAWKNSESQKATRELFVNSTKVFQKTSPIDNSGRFYYAVVPFIEAIEKKEIRKALGNEKYNELLTWHKNIDNDGINPEPTEADIDNSMLLALIRECVPLLVLSRAVRRFSINVLPEGVVQQFKSMMSTSNASQAALEDAKRSYCLDLDKEAQNALGELKNYINRANAEAIVWDLLPDNPSCQKFFRT